MPVAEFPGPRNWGYDGVHLFAPQSTYGGPRGLRRLVDACHAARALGDPRRGLQPPRAGGQLPRRVRPLLHRPPPHAVGQRRSTSTGPSRAGVRGTSSRTPAYWVREFHIDGLRLDAIHAIFDDEPGPHPHRARGGRARGGASARPARPRHRGVARQRPAPRAAARAGRPRARRRVVGRLPPRAARAAHRRAQRLLRRLRRRPRQLATGAGRGLRLPGRALGVLRARPRHPERGSSRRSLRDLRPESRPGRQPCPGRATGHHRLVSRPSSWPPASCLPRPPCRCCSWARSTARRRRSSSSRRSSTAIWPRPCAAAAPRSSRGSRWPGAIAGPGRARDLRALAPEPLPGRRARATGSSTRSTTGAGWRCAARHPALGAAARSERARELDAKGASLTLARERRTGGASA